MPNLRKIKEIKMKPKEQQKEDAEVASGRDTFQTPNYAIDLLIPFIPERIEKIWECAVGEWKIGDRLIESGYSVFGTDIRLLDTRSREHNFLLSSFIFMYPNSMIITNPPFSIKRQFYEKCLEYNLPFALLIPADYSGWIIEAIQNGAEKIIPTRRIDYITPTGLQGKKSASAFHSMWLTRGLNLGKSETFVELTNEEKRSNI